MTLTLPTVLHADVIKSRIGDHWNHWPELPVVSITEYDVATDPQAAYDFAYLYGTAQGEGVMRQVRQEQLPPELQRLLKSHKNLWYLNNMWFRLAGAMGQSDDAQTRNIYVVIPPHKGYDHVARKSVFTSPGVVVVIGCDHKFETVKLGNCFHRGTCAKCGHVFEVDSGD